MSTKTSEEIRLRCIQQIVDKYSSSKKAQNISNDELEVAAIQQALSNKRQHLNQKQEKIAQKFLLDYYTNQFMIIYQQINDYSSALKQIIEKSNINLYLKQDHFVNACYQKYNNFNKINNISDYSATFDNENTVDYKLSESICSQSDSLLITTAASQLLKTQSITDQKLTTSFLSITNYIDSSNMNKEITDIDSEMTEVREFKNLINTQYDRRSTIKNSINDEKTEYYSEKVVLCQEAVALIPELVKSYAMWLNK
ncbi:Hypothetical_protein [Hexamita inflata]|uniref:Hypothetical_protein n=1 Tax=Hexamita inflata TaxID=28002 RepID=A0AA86NLF8_9EUKA|nr:Hypothetical protein HINF_LOCUS8676 [Hexamita inflata]